MDFYSIEDGKLIFENNGETLQIEAWGENSLRVRSRMMGEILDTDFSLLPSSSNTKAKIEINKETQTATIKNGKITASIVNQSRWETSGRISFFNEKGELLLKEISSGGALKLQARAFKPIIGGDYKLTASFEGDAKEKIYGMDNINKKFLI